MNLKDISYGRLLGEFMGTLEGILFWDIPDELKIRLEERINKLESLSNEYFDSLRKG